MSNFPTNWKSNIDAILFMEINTGIPNMQGKPTPRGGTLNRGRSIWRYVAGSGRWKIVLW